MKSLKTTLLISMLALGGAHAAFAESMPVAASTVATGFTAADTQRLFEPEAPPLQLAALSPTEMRETEGALIPVAVAGAILTGGAVGGVSYQAANLIRTGSPGSTTGAMYAVGAGMLGGAFTGVMLSAAGISTSLFARAAWTGGNQYGNIVIRANGTALGQSWLGGYSRMPPGGCSYPCPNKN